jgi:hypothetical protein
MRLFINILENLAVSIFTKPLLVLCSEAEDSPVSQAEDSPVSQNIYTLPNYSHFISREWES